MNHPATPEESVQRCTTHLREAIDETVKRLSTELTAHARLEAEANVRDARAAVETELARMRTVDAELAAQAQRDRDQQVEQLRVELQKDSQAEYARLEQQFEERLVAQLTEALSDASKTHVAELARLRAQASQAAALQVKNARAAADKEAAAELERLKAQLEAAPRALPPASKSGKSRGAEPPAARVAEEVLEPAAIQRQQVFLGLALVRNVRNLEQATTVTQVLDGLAHSLATEAGRVVMLILRGADAEVWTVAGFDAELNGGRRELRREEIETRTRGAIAQALDRGELCYARRSDTGGTQQSGLRFAELPEGKVGLAIPLQVYGHAVAVVYADDVVEEGRSIVAAWPEFVEVLVRHAARCLERLTRSGVAPTALIPPLAAAPVSR